METKKGQSLWPFFIDVAESLDFGVMVNLLHVITVVEHVQ
jgi:hypothetical protein